MAPKGRGGRGGKGKQTHRQNNPAVSGSNPDARRDFPRNVIFAILTRLPVKSVFRFACASKSWRTVVSLPAFATVHLSRSRDALLINGERTQVQGHIIYTFRPPNPESGQPSGSIDRILKFPGSDGVVTELNVVVGAAPNGVVCIIQEHLAQNFTLWNPATGSLLRIPVPGTPSPEVLLGASAGLGFNPTSKGYAIIRIVRYRVLKQPDVAYLFNFHNGRWDNLGKVTFRPEELKCDAVVNGVPYWKAWESDKDYGPILKLVYFDVRNSFFRSEWFGWIEPEKKEMHFSEIRAGYLGAIVWDRVAEGGSFEDRVLEVWTRATNGSWSQMYRIDPMMLPYLGRVLGFYGDVELVQEIILGPAENWKPALCIIKLGGDVGVRGFCNLVGVRLGSCMVTRFRESLTRLPKIGNAMI